jgi:hypothetical protein
LETSALQFVVSQLETVSYNYNCPLFKTGSQLFAADLPGESFFDSFRSKRAGHSCRLQHLVALITFGQVTDANQEKHVSVGTNRSHTALTTAVTAFRKNRLGTAIGGSCPLAQKPRAGSLFVSWNANLGTPNISRVIGTNRTNIVCDGGR